jgi:hypothetical protein
MSASQVKAALTVLRGVYEPYNPHRRIMASTPSPASPTWFAVPADYPDHLRDILSPREDAEHLGHIRRTLLVKGDLRGTLPRYLDQNPHTITALTYFDLDLYEPTRDTLKAIQPYLTRGSVLAFDQLTHPKWPGETTALRDTLGIDHGSLHLLPGRATPTYLR